MKRPTKTIAELQSSRKLLEQDLKLAQAATDATSKAKADAINARMESIDSQLEYAEAYAIELKARELKADEAVKALQATGKLPPQDAIRAANYKQQFIENPDSIEMVAGEALKAQAAGALTAANGKGGAQALVAVAGRVAPIAGALTAVDGRINRFALEAGASYSFEFANGWSAKEAIAGYAEIQGINQKCGWNPHDHGKMEEKRNRSIEAGNWYKAHLAPNHAKWEHIPGWALQKMCLQDGGLQASDYTSGTLGTLSGTLVLQRSLPNFAFSYPELLALYTDFSDTPGLFNQTETTRVVIQPAVQQYSTSTDATGLPVGWAASGVTGTTVDTSITLTDYIGVPILINNAVLASTTRRLFDEQAVLSVKAIAGYFTGMLTNLLTSANFSAYAATTTNYAYPGAALGTGGQVPIAYPTYPVNSGTFAVSDLDRIHAAFSSNKVPKEDRGILLNPTFYAKLRSDPRFYFLYMGAAKTIATPGDYLGEPLLPRISGFAPYEAPYLPTATPSVVTAKLANPVATTANVAGWAFQKSGVMLKSRLPQDFTQAVNAMVPGSVTTITDPDTKISIMLVQFVDLTRNFAEWRPEIILGAAVADVRGGMVLTGT
jgi:hypothetical protein